MPLTGLLEPELICTLTVANQEEILADTALLTVTFLYRLMTYLSPYDILQVFIFPRKAGGAEQPCYVPHRVIVRMHRSF